MSKKQRVCRLHVKFKNAGYNLVPKDRHGKWLSHSLETSGICSIEFILHLSAFIRSQGGFLLGQNSVTVHILTYHQGEGIVTNAIVYDSITSKRNTILYFLSKNCLGSTHIRTMLTIKVYKIFLVTVVLKLLIMIFLYWYISQEKQLVRYFISLFNFSPYAFINYYMDHFTSCKMIIGITFICMFVLFCYIWYLY